MKKYTFIFALLIIIILPCFALAEVKNNTATSSDSTATANLSYSPTSYYTSLQNPRNLDMVNPYASLMTPVPVGLLDDYTDFTDRDVLNSLNIVDWTTYNPRTRNPFKVFREILSYIAGTEDYISPTNTMIINGKRSNDPNRQITYIAKRQTVGCTAIGYSTARSLEREIPILALFDANQPLRLNTDAQYMSILKKVIDEGVAEGNASSVSTAFAKALGKGVDIDAEQFSTGFSGVSGKTRSRRERLPDYLVIVYQNCQAEETKTETSKAAEALPKATALYLQAPVFFDFDKYDVRAAEVSKIAKIADAVYRELSADDSKKIYFVGNCDIRGAEGYNDTLGMNRGISARSAIIAELSKRGVKINLEKRLFFASAGKRQKAFEGNDEISHQLNRRVDVIVAKDITNLEALPLPELTQK